MTRIRIKTDSMRKEATVSNSDRDPTLWRLEMSGFKPVDYKAATMSEAVAIAEVNVPNMVKDGNAPVKRAGNSAALEQYREWKKQQEQQGSSVAASPASDLPVRAARRRTQQADNVSTLES